MIYGLPIESTLIRDVSTDDTIDMSDLRFPETVKNPQKIALLFIRNTGIKANFVFSKCTYEERREYLLLFMTGTRVNVTIKELSSTWAKILSSGRQDNNLYSILSDDEIIRFKEENTDLVNELYRFIISIPLCSMDVYASVKGCENIKVQDDFKISTYEGFNQFGLVQLFDYEEMILLSLSINDIEPVFYQNYFESKLCKNYPGFVGDLVNKFPYFQLLNIVSNNQPDLLDQFSESIERFYHPC